jgi:hypothetical protein
MRPLGVADLLAALVTLTDLDQEILRLVGWEELTVAAALRGQERDVEITPQTAAPDPDTPPREPPGYCR